MKTKFFSKCANEEHLNMCALKIKDNLQLDSPENKTLRMEVESEYNFLLASFKPSENDSTSKELTQEEVLEKLSPLKLQLEV